MAREGSGFNEITAHVIEALKDSSEPLKYGVPGWIPDEVRRQVDLQPTREGLSEEYVNTLNQMAIMATECNKLACDFDKWTVKNKVQVANNAKTKNGQKDLLSMMQARRAISSEWSLVRRLYYTVDEHLLNAMNYHQIHQDIEGVFAELARLEKKIDHLMSNLELPEEKKRGILGKIKDALTKDSSDDENDKKTKLSAYNVLKTFADIFAQFLLLNAASGVLSDKSVKIVPVNKRVEKLQDPVTVTSLCSFKTDKHVVTEGEPMFLIDNSNTDEWKVRNARGEEFVVPAVTIRIPPVDKKVIDLAKKLQAAIRSLWDKNELPMRKEFVDNTIAWLKSYLADDSNFEVVSKKKKGDINKLIDQFIAVGSEYLATVETFPEFVKTVEQLKHYVEESSNKGEEDSRLISFHKKTPPVNTSYAQYKALRILFGPEPESGEWKSSSKSSEDAPINLEGQEVKKTVTTESSSRSQAHGEFKETFVITGVKDLKGDELLTIDDAKSRKILRQKRGLYKNTITNEYIPIGEAMNKGWIIVEKQTRQDKHEIQNTVGLLKITETKETRAYTIKGVIDPRNDKELSIQEARQEGILLTDEGLFVNPQTGDKMSIDDAVQCAAVVVEFIEDGRRGSTAIAVENTYAVYAVQDRGNMDRLTFDEAVDLGILNVDTGEYLDRSTNETMFVKQAIRRGYVKARIVENDKEIDSLMRPGRKVSVFRAPNVAKSIAKAVNRT